MEVVVIGPGKEEEEEDRRDQLYRNSPAVNGYLRHEQKKRKKEKHAKLYFSRNIDSYKRLCLNVKYNFGGAIAIMNEYAQSPSSACKRYHNSNITFSKRFEEVTIDLLACLMGAEHKLSSERYPVSSLTSLLKRYMGYSVDNIVSVLLLGPLSSFFAVEKPEHGGGGLMLRIDPSLKREPQYEEAARRNREIDLCTEEEFGPFLFSDFMGSDYTVCVTDSEQAASQWIRDRVLGAGVKRVGLDTESDIEYVGKHRDEKDKRGNKLALIQIATRGDVLLYQCYDKSSFPAFDRLWTDKDIEKITVGGRSDRVLLNAWTCQPGASVIDLGANILGLSTVGCILLGVRVFHKTERQMHAERWSRKKLTPEQEYYASVDACLPLLCYEKCNSLGIKFDYI